MDSIRVAIIGGGPAGLVTLKTLLEASTPERPIEAVVFEAERSIGGTFRYRSYENAELVSSKQLTAFSDHRFPLDADDHISLPKYCEYLESYVERFDLARHIKLGTRVLNVRPTASDSRWRHQVTFAARDPRDGEGEDSKDGEDGKGPDAETYLCSHLAICTGLHVTPNIPAIPGVENVRGDSLHSSEYKSRSQLAGRDVMILGCGETAMDVAYEAITGSAASVTMCFRTGFLSFPKVLNRFRVFGKTFGGRLPIDGLITNLFETAYVHRSVKRTRLRSRVSDLVIKKVMWFLTGTQEGCNQHVGTLPSHMLGRSYVFLNKSHRAMPYLNRPYRTPENKNRLLALLGNEYMDPPRDAASPRVVDTCSFPLRFDASGAAEFEPRPDRKDWRRMADRAAETGEPVRPTLLVYCTGYRQDFGWLDPEYPTAEQADVRNIVKADRPDVAFVGFVRPGVGAIPPIAEQQAMWWTALVTGRMEMPGSPGHYRLLARRGARIDYGVDYSTYMGVLAKDFGGAPGVYELWREHGLKILLIYCLGASFVPFYRLCGPFKSAVAPEVARVELLDTVMRRGITGNFFFGVVPMIFYGWLNAFAWLLDAVGVISEEKQTDGVDMEISM